MLSRHISGVTREDGGGGGGGGRTGLRYYGNCYFSKRDFGISVKISSVFGKM